jgi:hypothetical protein
MNEFLSISEIESKFGSEWVLIQDPQLNDAKEVQAGRVICHSKDRDEVDQKAIELKPRWFTVVFTGPPAHDLEFIL